MTQAFGIAFTAAGVVGEAEEEVTQQDPADDTAAVNEGGQ